MPVRNRFDVAQAFASLIGGGLQGYRQGERDQAVEQREAARQEREQQKFALEMEQAQAVAREQEAKREYAKQRIQQELDSALTNAGRVQGQSRYDQARYDQEAQRLEREMGYVRNLADSLQFDNEGDLLRVIEGAERAAKSRAIAGELQRADALLEHHKKLAMNGEIQIPPEAFQQIEQLYRMPGNGFGPAELEAKLREYRQAQASSEALMIARDETVQEGRALRQQFRGMSPAQRRFYDMYLSEYRMAGYTNISSDQAIRDLSTIAALPPAQSAEVFTDAFGWTPEAPPADPRAPGAVPGAVRKMFPDLLGAPDGPSPAAPTGIRREVQAILPLILQGIDPADAAQEAGIPEESFTEQELAWLERMIG